MNTQNTDGSYRGHSDLPISMEPSWLDAQREEADRPFELWDWIDGFFYRIWPAVGWVAVGMFFVATLILASARQ
jgi:hypothetical protein